MTAFTCVFLFVAGQSFVWSCEAAACNA